MAGEIYIGKLNNGHMVIGEATEQNGLKNAFMVMLIPDPSNQARIAIQLKSIFWPLSDDGANIKEEHLVSVTEITTADIIDDYIRVKNEGKLDIVTGEAANQVMSQLNAQMKKAKDRGIIKE